MIDYLIITDEQLTNELENQLRQLFNSEYQADYGEWTRKNPYGYASFDLRVLAISGNRVVGHAGCQKRQILVNDMPVTIAGTGGILVDKAYRNQGIARQLLHHLQKASTRQLGTSFGYLGCREAVVPFYEACGYVRIDTEEHSLNRLTRQPEVSKGTPIMVCDGLQPASEFPNGIINLQGVPW